MLEFFRRWRKMMGCMTLSMACIMMVGWVRSFTSADTLGWNLGSFGLFTGSVESMALTFGGITDLPFEWSFPTFTSAEFESFDNECKEVEWRIGFAGLRFGTNRHSSPELRSAFVVACHYLWIEATLILLSVCLLLSKPKPKPRPTTSEPPPA
jgi:hypothetical protein